ncbi:hypothetical protein GCM10009416_44230 [Craurococcus roseus]|uniref:Uncharacterized protein n=1 Tax=Craurococcus roseus TaxID=77585 RepID=A0ABN1G0M6_9PROT
MDGSPNALLDRELLEMVLFLDLPRRHTKPMTPASMHRFGGFADAIAAPAGELDAVPGFGDAGVTALKVLEAVEAATAAVLGIVVHELLVVGRRRHAPIRREGLL